MAKKSLADFAAEKEIKQNPAADPAEPATYQTKKQGTETEQPESISHMVFTPDGKEFILPAQLEEYRKENPVGADAWEKRQERNAILKDRLSNRLNNYLSAVNININTKEFTDTATNIAIRQLDKEEIKNTTHSIIEAGKEVTTQNVSIEATEVLDLAGSLFADFVNGVRNTLTKVGEFFVLHHDDILTFLAAVKDVEPLLPYIEKEYDEMLKEHLIKDTSIDALFENGVDENGNETPCPFEILIERAKNKKQQDDNLSKLAKAEKAGAITSIGERLFVPSDKEYQNALITSATANTGIFSLDENGNKRNLELEVDTPFLQMLGKAVLIDYPDGKQSDIGTTIYFPTIARELGLDLNRIKAKEDENETATAGSEEGKISDRAKAREEYILQTIKQLDNIWGKLPGDQTFYKLISVHAYNPETEDLTFDSPYLKRLIGRIAEKEEKALSDGAKYYYGTCDLIHASVASEKNPAAVEMATRICVGVQQRGLIPDSKLLKNKNKNIKDEKLVTWEMSISGLIDACPKIKYRLASQKDNSNRTKLLQRTLKAVYKILHNKSDLFHYYKDVTVTEIKPTIKTLDDKIVITHHGGNPNYKGPARPFTDMIIDI